MMSVEDDDRRDARTSVFGWLERKYQGMIHTDGENTSSDANVGESSVDLRWAPNTDALFETCEKLKGKDERSSFSVLGDLKSNRLVSTARQSSVITPGIIMRAAVDANSFETEFE